MPAYILRVAGTNKLTGFYAADTRLRLIDLVDQETDPSDYECAVIRDGFGIEFRKGLWPVEVTIGEPQNLNDLLTKADHLYLTGELVYALTGLDELNWRKL